jgi:hypothetical protein
MLSYVFTARCLIKNSDFTFSLHDLYFVTKSFLCVMSRAEIYRHTNVLRILRNVHTDLRPTHPTTKKDKIDAVSPEEKMHWPGVTTYICLVARLRTRGSIHLPPPLRLHCMHRNNFTVTFFKTTQPIQKKTHKKLLHKRPVRSKREPI